MLNSQQENKETNMECMHDQLRMEDCKVSLDGDES